MSVVPPKAAAWRTSKIPPRKLAVWVLPSASAVVRCRVPARVSRTEPTGIREPVGSGAERSHPGIRTRTVPSVTSVTAERPSLADIAVTVTTRQKSAKVTQTYSCQGEAGPMALRGKFEDERFFLRHRAEGNFLKRGANGTMMLANPNSSLAIVDLCSKAADGKTKSDDKVYRLQPMPQSACAP